MTRSKRKREQLLLAITTFGTVVSISKLSTLTGPDSWRYFLAGGVCAAFSHAITTPIDVVKTRQQVDTEFQKKTFLQGTIAIVRNEGISTLLAGLGPTTVGYLLEGGLKFGIYEVLKPLAQRFCGNNLTSFVLSGTIAGMVASVVLCPMEALRIRMVAETNFCRNWWEGYGKMFQREGLEGQFKGLKAMMLKQVPYTVTKNVSFDILTRTCYQILMGEATATVKALIPLVCAFVASILSCISSHPGDVLLSLVNAHPTHRKMREFVGDVYRENGYKGFFVGIKARFFHVGTIVTTQLLIYDLVKRLCGIAPTGSV